MRRRTFIAMLGGATAWPLAVRAQQPGSPVIGFLGAPARAAYGPNNIVALHHGLKETGYVEGRNLAIEERWAENQYDRLPALAADLVAQRVAVIVTIGGAPAAVAAKAATSTIPIVFHMGADPVQLGLVASLNRPGGNITGATLLGVALDAKRLELLREVVPAARLIALLMNPANPQTGGQSREVLDAAHTIGQPILIVHASSEREIDRAFTELVEKQAGGLVIGADTYLVQSAPLIAALASRLKIPTIAQGRQFAEAGGLMSYSTDIAAVYRQVGTYAGRILKGERPADLPVQNPTRFDLVINLKTAKVLGVEIPRILLARADEVIE